MIILGSPFMFGVPNLIDTITSLGLTSGLKLCLDAGDAISYTSGQTWADRSGNGYDFFRGTTSASQSTDPTFNGTPGGASSSEYWSFDGGDYFTYDTTNETWMNNIHKNNALFTLAFWVRPGSIGAFQGLIGDYTSPSPSFDAGINPGGTWGFEALINGTGSIARAITSTATVSAGSWAFLLVSVDEASGTGFLQTNATQEAMTTTYSSPSSSNAGTTLRLADTGDGAFPLSSGGRMASVVAWEGTSLSTTQATALYDATKTKFGL